MNLLKTSFYTSFSTAATFISGFIVTKVVAVKIGPSGIAYVGQYLNATAIFTMLGIAAINTGVIKYLAEYTGDKEKQQKVITTAITIILSSSFLVSLIVIIFSSRLSQNIFKSDDLRIVFILYGLFLTLISLNSFSLAVLNGLKKIKNLTIINIAVSLIGVACTVVLVKILGLKGALLAPTLTALIMFVINVLNLNKIEGIHFRPNFKFLDKKVVKILFAFSLMNIVSGLMGPAMQLSVRDYIIKNISDKDAGYWQAVTRISEYYLGFISAVLSVYYIPRLSEIKEKHELNKEIVKGYKMILPAVAFLALAIWFTKELIVRILLTPDFLPMLPLFKYQLLGDFLKIGSWLLSFLMLSKAMTKTFIITEVVFACSYIALCYWLMANYGLIGSTYAFAINYGVYWIVMWLLMKKYLTLK